MTKEKMGCSQEMLKLIACVTMLIDHIGAVLFPGNNILRIIGRIAFPIYCFLLIEGANHTSSPKKYSLRLLIGAIISEIPYDIALHNRITLEYQNIMWTLLLGYIMILLCKQCKNIALKIIVISAFAIIAEFCGTDYGFVGILTIAVFYFSHEKSMLWTILGLSIISLFNMAQVFALFAIFPIMAYNGKKITHNKTIQYIFYLFYPMHLLALYIIRLF